MIILSLLTALASAQGICPTDHGTVVPLLNVSTDAELRLSIDGGPMFSGARATVSAVACSDPMIGAAWPVWPPVPTEGRMAQCGATHGLQCAQGEMWWPLSFPTWQFVNLDSSGRAVVTLPNAATFQAKYYLASVFIEDLVGNKATDGGPIRMDPVCPFDNGTVNRCYFCECETGEGNCAGEDGRCAQGLQCSPDMGSDFGLPPTVDVCMDPASPSFCSVPLGDPNRCWECGPCAVGEGACTHALDCIGGAFGDTECDYNPTLGWNTCQVVVP